MIGKEVLYRGEIYTIASDIKEIQLIEVSNSGTVWKKGKKVKGRLLRKKLYDGDVTHTFGLLVEIKDVNEKD